MGGTSDEPDISVARRAIWQAAGDRPPTFPEGRVCQQPACSTVLSIYNRQELCSKHQEARLRPPRQGRRCLADVEPDRRLVRLGDFLKV